MRLDSYALDDLHQVCCAEHGDRGPVCRLADTIYRLHVRLIIALIRAGRWGRR
jgi:hypothetical protein